MNSRNSEKSIDRAWTMAVLYQMPKKHRLVLRWCEHLNLDDVLRIDYAAMLSTSTISQCDRFLGRFRMVFGTTIPLAIVPDSLIAETWRYASRAGADPDYRGPIFAASDDEQIDAATLRDALSHALALVRLWPQMERIVNAARPTSAPCNRGKGGLTLAFSSFEQVREIVPGALYDLIIDRMEGNYRRHRRYTLSIGEDLHGHGGDRFIAEINSEDLHGQGQPKNHVRLRRKDRETAREAALDALMEELGIKPAP